MVIDLFGERVSRYLFYILIVVSLCTSSRGTGFLLINGFWICAMSYIWNLDKKTATFYSGGWHQAFAWQNTFFFLLWKLCNTLSSVPRTVWSFNHPTDLWGSRHPDCYSDLAAHYNNYIYLALMVKYCYLVSDSPEFCERDSFCLYQPAQETTTAFHKDAHAFSLSHLIPIIPYWHKSEYFHKFSWGKRSRWWNGIFFCFT